MTPEQLDELQRLHEAATPGPWEYDGMGTVIDESRERLATTHHQVTLQNGRCVSTSDIHGPLIVAMRNALPDLLAMARKGLTSDARADAYGAVLRETADSRDRYLAVLKAHAVEMVALGYREPGVPFDLHGVSMQVSYVAERGGLEAEEVK